MKNFLSRFECWTQYKTKETCFEDLPAHISFSIEAYLTKDYPRMTSDRNHDKLYRRWNFTLQVSRFFLWIRIRLDKLPNYVPRKRIK